MSNSSQVDEISSIAGEPANNSPLKSVPPLDGRKVNDQVEDDDLKPRGKKAMLIVQTITIIIALILSAYSFTIIEIYTTALHMRGSSENINKNADKFLRQKQVSLVDKIFLVALLFFIL